MKTAAVVVSSSHTFPEISTKPPSVTQASCPNFPYVFYARGCAVSIGGFEASEIREKVRRQHMTLIDRIVTRLKSVPEAGGSMFDNTMLFYFSDNGETHHSKGTEWPFIVLAGDNARLDIGRRYIRLPGYGKPGHKTLGNWYTTLLNGYGNNINHYGAMDVGLTIQQKGPIQQFLG
jgi:hypothetical protein